MWQTYALLSAFFAALTALFAKIGVKDVNSNLATAVRTLVILFITWGIVFATVEMRDIRSIPRWSLFFIVISGICTGASWLFYFKALQIGDVAKVAPIDKTSIIFTIIMAVIFLHEELTLKVAVGGALIAAGTLVMAL